MSRSSQEFGGDFSSLGGSDLSIEPIPFQDNSGLDEPSSIELNGSPVTFGPGTPKLSPINKSNRIADFSTSEPISPSHPIIRNQLDTISQALQNVLDQEEDEEQETAFEFACKMWRLFGSEDLIANGVPVDRVALFINISQNISPIVLPKETPAKSQESQMLQVLAFVLSVVKPKKYFQPNAKNPFNYSDINSVFYQVTDLLDQNCAIVQEFRERFSEIVESESLEEYASWDESVDHRKIHHILSLYEDLCDCEN